MITGLYTHMYIIVGHYKELNCIRLKPGTSTVTAFKKKKSPFDSSETGGAYEAGRPPVLPLGHFPQLRVERPRVA